MLAAVLTVSGPWLPARWRRWWWTLLLAFVPIHLVVSAIVPAPRSLGLAVGWFVRVGGPSRRHHSAVPDRGCGAGALSGW